MAIVRHKKEAGATQAALRARGTRGLGRPSFDARSQGHTWSLPLGKAYKASLEGAFEYWVDLRLGKQQVNPSSGFARVPFTSAFYIPARIHQTLRVIKDSQNFSDRHPMRENHLAGSRQRTARAKAHIRNLDRIVKSFIRHKPYKHVIEPHPDGVHEIHKLKARRRNLPRSFADVSTDAIENMRAALDQAVYAIAHVITNHRILRSVAFPFSSSAMDFQTRLNGVCPGFLQDILTLLESFKPYKGGDNTLWAINELANTSKHKTLTTVAFRIVAAYTHEISGMGSIVFQPQWDRPQNEFVLGTAMPNTRVKYRVSFGLNIGFDDIPVIAGKPIIGVLNDMASIVDRLIDKMESGGCRIGLFK